MQDTQTLCSQYARVLTLCNEYKSFIEMRIHYDCSLFHLISAGIVTVLMNAITMKITFPRE